MDFKTTDIEELYALYISQGSTPEDCVLEFEAVYKDGTKIRFGTEDVSSDVENQIAGRLNDIEQRRNTTSLFQQCFKDSKVSKENIHTFSANYKDQIEQYEELADTKSVDEVDSKDNTNKKGNKIALTGALAAIAIAAAIGGKVGSDKQETQAQAIETQVDVNNDEIAEEEIEETKAIVKPDMQGKNWEFYEAAALNYDFSNVDQTNLEEIKNTRGLIDQKTFMLTIYDVTNHINEAAQPYFENCVDENGNKVVFNITPEEVFALSARMNNLSNEEITNIMAGTSMDIDNILNIDSNSALKKMTAFYGMCSEESGIDKLFINEEEAQTVRNFEAANIAMLKAEEGKDKEEALNNLKDMYYDYFRTDNHSDEASWGSTDYILCSMMPSNTIMAEVYNIDGTVQLQKIGTENYVEAKTGLFNEAHNRIYIGTDNEANWEENFVNGLVGYNANNYQLVDIEKGLSIASSSCGTEKERLEEASDFVLNSDEVEKLSETSYNPQIILEMMTNELSNKYDFSNSASEIFMAFVNYQYDLQDAKTAKTGTSKKVANIGERLTKERLAALQAGGVNVEIVGSLDGFTDPSDIPNKIVNVDENSKIEAEKIKEDNDKKTKEEEEARKKAEEERNKILEEITKKAEEDGVTNITTDPTGAVDTDWLKDMQTAPDGAGTLVNSPNVAPEPVQSNPEPISEAAPEPVIDSAPESYPDGAILWSDDQILDNLGLNNSDDENSKSL